MEDRDVSAKFQCTRRKSEYSIKGLMNPCQYCGSQSRADATHCESCGTYLSAPTPERLAVLVSRLRYRQMFLTPLWAMLAALFLPSGLILLLIDSSRFAQFLRPDHQVVQKIAAVVFLSLGALSIFMGYRMHRKLSGGATAPSRGRTFLFLLSGLLFFIAIGLGLFGTLCLTYIFSGVP